MKARGVVIVLAVLAVAAAAISTTGGDGKGSWVSKAPKGAVRIPLVVSPEKEELLKPLVAKFNQRGGAFVELSVVASGEAQTRIAKGSLQPVLWSPSSSFWGRLLNYEADRPL